MRPGNLVEGNEALRSKPLMTTRVISWFALDQFCNPSDKERAGAAQFCSLASGAMDMGASVHNTRRRWWHHRYAGKRSPNHDLPKDAINRYPRAH